MFDASADEDSGRNLPDDHLLDPLARDVLHHQIESGLREAPTGRDACRQADALMR